MEKTMTAADLAQPNAAQVDPLAVARRKENKTKVDAPKGRTTFKKLPEEVCIAGVDYPADLDDPFYDERVDLTIDPDMVDDIDRNGVTDPPICIMDGELCKVNDGRRRFLHARAANVKRVARGEKPMVVEFFLDKGDAKQIFLAARRSNAYSVHDSTMLKARNARRAIERFGASVEEVAHAEKVKPQTVKDWMAALELGDVAKTAIDKGQISLTAALTLLKDVPRKDQPKVLAEAIEKSGGKVHERAAEAANKNERKKREPKLPEAGGATEAEDAAEPAPTKGVLKKLVRAYEKDPPGFSKKLFGGDKAAAEVFIKTLRYVLGDLNRKGIAGLTAVLRELGVVE